MAGGKETPRQKMIGLMYLVLIAMLALNVSVNVLDAFVLVEEGLTQTTRSFSIKNERLYNQMETAYTINPVRLGPWKEITDDIRERSQELIDYIQELKVEAVIVVEGEDSKAILPDNQVDTRQIKGKDNTTISNRVFIGSEYNLKGYELRDKIAEYRDHMLSLVDAEAAARLVESISTILSTDNPPQEQDGTQHDWVTNRFYGIPVAAIFPQLSKIQIDIQNVEAEVVGYLLNRVDAGDFKVNKLDAVVIPNTDYVIQGNDFRAEIFLAASDTTQVPRIYIGDYETFTNDQGETDYRMVGNYEEISVEGGKGVFTRRGTRLGSNRWAGLIEVTAPDGSKTRRPFSHSFEVAPPNFVVSPSRMNVFYRAVENPVDVSVPGIPPERVTAALDGAGTIRRAGSGYVVVPGRGNTCQVIVYAEIDGTRRRMGSQEFRVREVPNPEPAVRGITRTTVDANELAASLSVEARMPDWFEFDISYRITGFTVTAVEGGFTRTQNATNQLITEEQRNLIRRLRSGQTVSFIDITAVGPDGGTRELSPIVYRIR